MHSVRAEGRFGKEGLLMRGTSEMLCDLRISADQHGASTHVHLLIWRAQAVPPSAHVGKSKIGALWTYSCKFYWIDKAHRSFASRFELRPVSNIICASPALDQTLYSNWQDCIWNGNRNVFTVCNAPRQMPTSRSSLRRRTVQGSQFFGLPSQNMYKGCIVRRGWWYWRSGKTWSRCMCE